MSDISQIRGIEILDSRRTPTVAADVTLASGAPLMDIINGGAHAAYG